MVDLLLVVFISFFFGVSQKLADSVNEHGTTLFPNANYVFGVTFGLLGALLIVYNLDFYNFYLGLVLYWLVANKLDYKNHQIAAGIIIFVGLISSQIYEPNPWFIILVIGYSFLLKRLKKALLIRSRKMKILLQSKLYTIALAILIGITFNNYLLFFTISCTIFGIQITIWQLKLRNNYIEQ